MWPGFLLILLLITRAASFSMLYFFLLLYFGAVYFLILFNLPEFHSIIISALFVTLQIADLHGSYQIKGTVKVRR